ncbi:MAG: DUF1189 family protein [Acholeplasma sp.]|nr:DUF1189 family protein [Acholeplasma sp.]
MLKRINISIFKPSKIAFFLKDKLSYLFLYIAFLSLLASLPMIIRLNVTNQIPREIEEEITSLFIRNVEGCSIDNGKLDSTCETTPFTYQSFSVRFNEVSNESLYQIVFEEASINFYVDKTLLKAYDYQSLDMDQLDLSLSTEADQDKLIKGINMIYKDIKPVLVIYGSFMVFFANLILFVLLALIMAFFYGLRPQKLRFRFRFIMASYALTSYFILVLIGELYGLGLVSYLALILPYVYMGIAFSGLIKMSKIVIVSNEKEDESKDEDE